jgi:hypothetical protein
MSKLSHRTTLTLDAATAERIRKLASLWQVSQAEVVRRAIELAEPTEPKQRLDPVAMLQMLHSRGEGLDRKTGDAYLSQVRKDRKDRKDRRAS